MLQATRLARLEAARRADAQSLVDVWEGEILQVDPRLAGDLTRWYCETRFATDPALAARLWDAYERIGALTPAALTDAEQEVAAMNQRTRITRLEQRTTGARWCRCPFDREQSRAETDEAMRTGEPTPSICDRCGGARIAIQYVDRPGPGVFTLDIGRELKPSETDEATEVEFSRRRENLPEPAPVEPEPLVPIPEPPAPPEPALATIETEQSGLGAWLERRQRERLLWRPRW